MTQQYSRADLTRMTPRQIVEAKAAGHFDALLNGEDPEDGYQLPGQLTRDALKHMTPAEIVKAKAEGHCDVLLGRRDPAPTDTAA